MRNAPARQPRHIGRILLALALASAGLIQPTVSAGVVAAGVPPLAVIVVGPSAGATGQFRSEAAQIASQLEAYGARVQEVYSPDATWARVRAASRGANLFVYIGRGRGEPGPYGTSPRIVNGMGLNRSAGNGHRNFAWYGESYLRSGLALARDAVVILKRVPYAAGSSEAGRAAPSARTATARADNYAAGFLGAGASVVFASDRAVGTIVRDLFKSDHTMRSIFWNSPSTSTARASAFRSRRTSGATGLLAPYRAGHYFQSVTGRLALTAGAWRTTWGTTEVGPAAGTSIRVASVAALLSALANNAVGEIVVTNGTYRISPAAMKAGDSLWIGSRFASRTRPVVVRAETSGGVVFDGGGARMFGGITFAEGAHHQTWQGFTFSNGTPSDTGAIVFGGYAGRAAPHHITLRNISIPASVTSADSGINDHAVYFSKAVGGPHDIVIDGLQVDGGGGLDSALHFYHSDASNQNAWNVTVRRLQVTGTWQAIILADPTLRDITFESVQISGARNVAVAFAAPGATGIVFENVTSTESGAGVGFYSSLGSQPPGVTFINSTFK